jgi:hypothetical protein
LAQASAGGNRASNLPCVTSAHVHEEIPSG